MLRKFAFGLITFFSISHAAFAGTVHWKCSADLMDALLDFGSAARYDRQVERVRTHCAEDGIALLKQAGCNLDEKSVQVTVHQDRPTVERRDVAISSANCTDHATIIDEQNHQKISFESFCPELGYKVKLLQAPNDEASVADFTISLGDQVVCIQ